MRTRTRLRRERASCRSDRRTHRRCRPRARDRRSPRPTPTARAREGALRVRSQTNATSITGARYWISSATATGIRCIAEKNNSWQPSTGMSPNPRMSFQCRRRNAGCRRIARNSAGERMSPAMPIRTRSAAPSDQPASSSGLMNGPLEENASAEATRQDQPRRAHPSRGSQRQDGDGCGGSCHGGIRLSGVKSAYTRDNSGPDCQESIWFSFVTPSWPSSRRVSRQHASGLRRRCHAADHGGLGPVPRRQPVHRDDPAR